MIRKGTKVMWKDGNSIKTGKVIDSFTPKRKKTDHDISEAKNKDSRHKVLLIELPHGRQLIKRVSEVSRWDNTSAI